MKTQVGISLRKYRRLCSQRSDGAINRLGTGLLVFLIIMGLGIAPDLIAQPEEEIYIAWWNVENLFDLVDDPGVEDEEFTPLGENRWDRERLRAKFHSLTRVLSEMNEGKGPDLLGLGEVENRNVLEQWRDTDLEKFHYGYALHESPDERGIDLAVLYRRDLFSLIAVRGHSISLGEESGPTRDVSVFTFTAAGDTLDCVLVHWPSRYGGREETEPLRIRAATVTRRVVDSLYSVRKNDDILLMGDFNDEPTNISVRETLQQGMQPEKPAEAEQFRLYNAMIAVDTDPDRGTYYYDGEWNTLDQILLGRGLFRPEGFAAVSHDASVFVRSFMREQEGEYKDSPYRTYVGDRYLGGISDHFPVFIRITLN